MGPLSTEMEMISSSFWEETAEEVPPAQEISSKLVVKIESLETFIEALPFAAIVERRQRKIRPTGKMKRNFDVNLFSALGSSDDVEDAEQ